MKCVLPAGKVTTKEATRPCLFLKNESGEIVILQPLLTLDFPSLA
jgi:hypothetical protein